MATKYALGGFGGLELEYASLMCMQHEMSMLYTTGSPKTGTIVNRLPADILIAIFKLLLPRPIPYEIGVSVHYPIRIFGWDWTTVTHVCRHWRAIATDTAVLWTSIPDFRSIDKVKIFLLRSKGAALRVYFNTKKHINFDKTLDAGSKLLLILQHLGRTEELHLRLPQVHNTMEFEIWGKVIEMLKQPAPKLGNLSLLTNESGFGTALPHLFSESTPTLRSLFLTGITIPTHQSLLQSLTWLCLRNSQGLTRSTLISILGANPALSTLQLYNIKTLPDSDGIQVARTFQFHSLRHLTITGEGPDIDNEVRWLRTIQFRHDLNWVITRTSELPPSPHGSFQLDLLEALLQPPMRCVKLTIMVAEKGINFLSASHVIQDGSESHALTRVELQVEWRIPAHGDQICELIKSLVLTGYWRTAEEVNLDVTYLGAVTDESSRNMWAEFQSVHSIRITHRSDYELSQTFAGIIGEQPSIISGQLCNISIEVGPKKESEQTEVFQTLKNSLKKRDETNMRISKLEFIGKFELKEIDVAEISCYVDEFLHQRKR